MARSLCQGRRDVINAQSEMVQPLTTPRDEAADIRFRGEGFEKLDARGAFAEEGDTNIRETFIALQVQAEAGLEVRTGGVDGTDGPTEVVDGRHARGGAQEWRSIVNLR